MRIFYASDTTPNAALRGSNLWRNNLLLPLRDLGHDVVEFDYDLRDTFQHLDTADAAQRAFVRQNRPQVSAALIEQIRCANAEAHIDLLFTYFYDACVLPATIDAIREMGIVTVNWYCNGSYQMNLVSEIAPHYDWCLVPEKFRLGDYQRLGARPIYCQEAANPTIYMRHDVALDYDVTFVGQAYGERPQYIRRLLGAGIDVRVWGPGWNRYSPPSLLRRMARKVRGLVESGYEPMAILPQDRLGPPLSDDEMIKMYSRSKINLGFSSVGNTHREKERIVQIRLRDFEVPMSGGFYMVEYMDELEEFFVPDKEVVCYTDPEDLASKIKFYLLHDEERERIRRAGYDRAHRDHTWHRRFETVFGVIGLGAADKQTQSEALRT